MTIEIRCRSCGVILSVADEHAGSLARCPKCQNEYTVPIESDAESLDAVCHFCGVVMPNETPSDAKFKTCDECEESIAENQSALTAEQEAAERFRKTMMFTAVLAAMTVAILLMVGLVRSYFARPAELPFGPSGEHRWLARFESAT